MAEAFETILNYLRRHGVWTNSATYGLEDFMSGFLGFLMVLICTFLSLLHLRQSIEGHFDQFEPDEIILGVELIFVSYIFCMFLNQVNEIIPFVEDIRTYRFGKPPGLNELLKKQSKYSKTLYIYTIIGTCVYAIVSFLEFTECEKTKKVGQFCFCLYPIWLPSYFRSIRYVRYLSVVMETIAALSTMLPFITGNYFAAAVTEHITIRVKHLRMMLRKFSKISLEKQKMSHLVYCIEYHVDIIRLTDRVTKTFGKLNNIHSLTPIIIGALNFKLFMILSIKDSLHVLGWIFSIGILCHNGQELINECQALASDVYDLKWYSLSTRSRYYIGMLLLRTQIPLRITAGIFYSYSYEFMMVIMQISYSYTTVLTQIFKIRDS